MAAALAALEVQIEGRFGWAQNLPTWRAKKNNPLAKVYSWVMSGKPLTGYHVAIFSFVILAFHTPFVFGVSLTLESWLKTVSLLLIFLVAWDFLWFVFNPDFTVAKFNRTSAPWHKRWLGGIPVDYWKAFAASFAVLAPLAVKDAGIAAWWLFSVFDFLFFAAIAVFASKLFLKGKSR